MARLPFASLGIAPPASGGIVDASLELSGTLRAPTLDVRVAGKGLARGKLDRLDDFIVALTTSDGTHRSFATRGDTPRVEVHDPLEPHRSLLRVYSDSDIHNVTAYLVTLK